MDILYVKRTKSKDKLDLSLRRLRNQHRGENSFARRQPPIRSVLDALVSTPYSTHIVIVTDFCKNASKI